MAARLDLDHAQRIDRRAIVIVVDVPGAVSP
jgi:hypothetical protein